jgi:hypothetical protein
MRVGGLIAIVLLALVGTNANAKTYLYGASCGGSYTKEGEQNDDLTKQSGKPISCTNIVFSIFDNGRTMLQIVDKSSHLTPLGFSGGRLDPDINPNFLTLPLDKIYLPHYSNPATPQTITGIEGFCFFDGKLNLRNLTSVSCAAKFELGSRRVVYHIDVKFSGIGAIVPEPR